MAQPATMTPTPSPLPYSPLDSPGVGARRRTPKGIPRLPLSAFTPPNSGASDKFPLAPSPSTVIPNLVLDADVQTSVDQWQSETKDALGKRSHGVVLSLKGKDAESIAEAQQNPLVLAISIPFPLEDGEPAGIPDFLTSPAPNVRISFRTIFKTFTPQFSDGIHWAVSRGHVVDIDVQSDLSTEEGWESLNELLSNALNAELPQTSSKKGAVVLSNVLPAPHDLTLPLVKLLTHPLYHNFQSYMASISLLSSVYVKYVPPSWNAPPPSGEAGDAKEKKEWKRRIKMYLGHAIEAFGYQRIIYGSSGPSSSSSGSNAGYWYQLARESMAELHVEQEAVDAVFGGNAKSIYC